MTDGTRDLYVLDPDQHVVSQLRPGLAEAKLHLAGSMASADQALPSLMSTCPDVVLIDVASAGDIAFTVKKIQLACPTSCIIVTGAGTPPATMSRAVASGARGFLIKPYTPADVFTTIAEALEMAQAVASQVQVQTRAQVTPPAPERSRGTVVAVYSPKGGVGSTTVATNVAVALAARPHTSVALLDLDLQFGDVGSSLDLRGANSVAEVVGTEELTPELIDETFVKHASGVRVLLAPDDLALVEGIDPEQVVQLLSQLRRHFDFVVADLWSSYEALTVGVLRAADRVVLVTTPELPSLRNVQRVLHAAADIHLADKALIVANRYPGKTGVSEADMSKALGQKISATIPSEGVTVTDAINRGLSLLDSRARVRSARHYHALASLIAGAQTAPALVIGDRLKEAHR